MPPQQEKVSDALAGEYVPAWPLHPCVALATKETPPSAPGGDADTVMTAESPPDHAPERSHGEAAAAAAAAAVVETCSW